LENSKQHENPKPFYMKQLGRNTNVLIVGVGDLKIAGGEYKLRTLLGCCVGICIYHPEKKIGGLIHAMLPKAPHILNDKKSKYVDAGIDILLKKLENEFGVEKEQLVAKIFGGAKMLPSSDLEIGNRNSSQAEKILKNHRIPILAKKVGGEKGYRIELDLSSGRVICQIFGEKEKEY
jgi:chemotaxis protein CheD